MMELRWKVISFLGMFMFIMGLNKNVGAKKKSASCPGENYAQLDTTCYYYISSVISWNSAEEDCETRGGTLIIFDKKDEFSKAFKLIKAVASEIDTINSYWVGVHNQDDDGVFRWADGNEVTSKDWKKKLNKATGGNCVVLKSEGKGSAKKKWELRNCSDENPYVCEMELSKSRWTGWSKWSPCSVSCGDGAISRTRTCLRPTDASSPCTGKSVQTKACSTKCGVWDNWNQWSTCDVTCGTGRRSRTRDCSEKKKNSCKGKDKEADACTAAECPVWDNWNQWSTCDVTCGTGERSRTRDCSEKKKNSCKGKDKEADACAAAECPVWRDWNSWSSCDVTCGQGTRSRTRTCAKAKKCKGDSSEVEVCTESECAANDNWNQWTACDVTCGTGKRSRTRVCSGRKKKSCQGKEAGVCKAAECPVWLQWSEWSSCSETCGKGKATRSRSCSSGIEAGCRGSNKQQKKCNSPPCRDKYKWTHWDLWSSCSVTCGVGIRTRSRRCANAYGDTSNTCHGVDSRSKTCLALCKDLFQVEQLIAHAPPEKVKYLRKIAQKLANKKLKEQIFNGKESENWVLAGYEIGNYTIDRPLTCARLCIRTPGCRSFNYQDLLTNGENDLSVKKVCILNSARKDEVDRSSLELKEGYKLFDVEPFFD